MLTPCWLAGVINDLYQYDKSEHKWALLTAQGIAPSARSNFAFTAALGRIYVFGGTSGELTILEKARALLDFKPNCRVGLGKLCSWFLQITVLYWAFN